MTSAFDGQEITGINYTGFRFDNVKDVYFRDCTMTGATFRGRPVDITFEDCTGTLFFPDGAESVFIFWNKRLLQFYDTIQEGAALDTRTGEYTA